MAYYTREELEKIGFKSLGETVMISTLAQVYHPELIEIGSHVRIDDFSILSNKIIISDFVHVAARSLIDGGSAGIEINDYTGIAYNSIVIASTDSYRLEGFFGPWCLPPYRKNLCDKHVVIGKYSLIGSLSLVLPGVEIAEGCSFAAYSLVIRSTLPWGFYAGQPARRVSDNDKGIIEMARLNTIEVAKRESHVRTRTNKH